MLRKNDIDCCILDSGVAKLQIYDRRKMTNSLRAPNPNLLCLKSALPKPA